MSRILFLPENREHVKSCEQRFDTFLEHKALSLRGSEIDKALELVQYELPEFSDMHMVRNLIESLNKVREDF